MTLRLFRASADTMKTHRNLFQKLCSYDNLLLAFMNARKGKAKKEYVIEFGQNLENNLYALQWELLTHTYRPKPLTTFTVHDPKTRKISASNFRDRVIHHAVCNIIAPIFESRFICDTFANRKGKGTLAALNRFQHFLLKVAGSGRPICRERDKNPNFGFALKCDIKHYFETVDHVVLFSILRKRIKDEELLWLIRVILENHRTPTPGKGMPLGNLTSQFLANVYLSELDNFAKHKLKAKYYLRHVDDFVLLGKNKELLEQYRVLMDAFLKQNLKLELHPDKSRVVPLRCGLTLLGFRIFHHYRLLKKSNRNRIYKRLAKFREKFKRGEITKEKILLSMAGWDGYAKMGNTFRLRERVWADARTIIAGH